MATKAAALSGASAESKATIMETKNHSVRKGLLSRAMDLLRRNSPARGSAAQVEVGRETGARC